MFTKESVKNYIKRLFTYVITIITAHHRTELKIVHAMSWFYTKIFYMVLHKDIFLHLFYNYQWTEGRTLSLIELFRLCLDS